MPCCTTSSLFCATFTGGFYSCTLFSPSNLYRIVVCFSSLFFSFQFALNVSSSALFHFLVIIFAHVCMCMCTLTASPPLCLSPSFRSSFFVLFDGRWMYFSYKRIFSLLNVAFTFDLCKMQCRLCVLDSVHLCLFNVLHAQVFLTLRAPHSIFACFLWPLFAIYLGNFRFSNHGSTKTPIAYVRMLNCCMHIWIL